MCDGRSGGDGDGATAEYGKNDRINKMCSNNSHERVFGRQANRNDTHTHTDILYICRLHLRSANSNHKMFQ